MYAIASAHRQAPAFLKTAEKHFAGLSENPARLLETFCLAVHLSGLRPHPYAALLSDRSGGHPLLMADVELAPLEASPAAEQIRRRARFYTRLHAALLGGDGDGGGGGGGVDGSNCQSSGGGGGGVPLRSFLGAVGAILSRATSAGPLALVPYLDFLNHCNDPNCSIEYDDAMKTYVVVAERDCAPFEELFIDYGAGKKGAYQFLRTYGFGGLPSELLPGPAKVLVHRPGDELVLPLLLPPSLSPPESDAAAAAAETGPEAAFGAAATAAPHDRSSNGGDGDTAWRLPVRFVADVGGPTLPPPALLDREIDASSGDAGRRGGSSAATLQRQSARAHRERRLQRLQELEAAVETALAGYIVPLKEDLRWLRGGEAMRTSYKDDAAASKKTGLHGTVAAADLGWERQCHMVRAGEKAELVAALRGVQLLRARLAEADAIGQNE
ncbi:unnamed protein product [Phaeothamnion confervicola]